MGRNEAMKDKEKKIQKQYDQKREQNINILICNENENLIKTYKNLLAYIAGEKGYDVMFSLYESGKEALFCEEDRAKTLDLILIGWEYRYLRGINIARAFRKNECEAEIIFLGMEIENILDSFQVNPFYYFIEKEVTHGKFEEVIIKCFRLILDKKNNSLCFTQNGKMNRINMNRIVYMKVEHRVTQIYCQDNQEYSFYESLKNVEQSINNENFVRIHRGYIVNLNYVDCVDKGELYLVTGEKLPVARNYKQDLVEKMIQQEKTILL